MKLNEGLLKLIYTTIRTKTRVYKDNGYIKILFEKPNDIKINIEIKEKEFKKIAEWINTINEQLEE
jgi:hypothetical protein